MKITNRREGGSRGSTERGAILLVVLIVMVALLGLGMTGLFLTSGSIQMNTNINLRNQALVVAEAGIERARIILNNPDYTPPVPTLLAGSGSSADEVPSNTTECQGQSRGAILVDPLQLTAPCTNTPCPLNGIVYPSVDRTAGLPSSAGRVASASLGRYTVYIRQDMADCRMGNFVCDQAPPSSVDSGIGGAFGQTTCVPPAGAPTPNGAVVVRSEGLAADGRTRVVLEVTMTPAQGVEQAHNTPMSALCSAGVNGCDDNSSVQNGIVVNSPAPENPPPSLGGASGFGGSAGGAGGVGGAGGAGGGSTFPGTSVGGSSGGSGGSGGTGGTGTGGIRGSGGSTTCPGASCARIAILGVPGVWDPSTNAADPNSGWSKFQAWLGTHSDNCQNPDDIDIQTTKITSTLLSKYNVLILLDLYHTKAERDACVAATNIQNCGQQKCYKTDGSLGFCSNVTATYTSTATSTDVAVVAGCPKTTTFTATVTRTSTATGTSTGTVATTIGSSRVTGNASYTVTSTSTGTGTTTAVAAATCGYPPGTKAGSPYPTGSYVTSYNYGSARILDSSELSAIENWAKQGNGFATTTSYYYYAPEVTNVNNILARFNLKYKTSDAAGHIVNTLSGTYGGGVDIGHVSATINDFMPGAPPFNYKNTVNLLQMRSGVPILQVTGGTGNVHLAAEVDNSCPVGNTNYGNGNCTYSQAQCTALSSPIDVGFYVDGIGASGGRVVAWSDEWLTYDTVWNTLNSCGNHQYQPDYYWENVVRWLGHCNAN